MSTDGSDPDLNDLAVAVQNLTEEDEVRQAGEQLKPETNFATQQAAITLNQAVGQHIDTRLASVGATGSNGSFAQPSGLGMKQKDPNRSNLGGAGGSTKTTVTPVIDHVVHSGEWFLVAKELYGGQLPGVEGNTVLVSWEIDKNASNALVVGSTVADASIIDGLSKPGVATLNALISSSLL